MRFTDHRELESRLRRRAQQRRKEIIWNILTGVMILASVMVIGVFLVLFSNPNLPLNPFPPPTLPVLITQTQPVDTTTSPSLEAPTLTPTYTPTPEPIPPTETPIPPTATLATATSNPNGDEYPYALEGDPVALANVTFHPGDSCQWQGVAGRVVDLQGRHVVGLTVRLTGVFGDRTIDMNTVTGGASAWYGESGYEFILGTTPQDTKGTLTVQLIDQSMLPISDGVIFDTFSACDKNLILINFRQIQ